MLKIDSVSSSSPSIGLCVAPILAIPIILSITSFFRTEPISCTETLAAIFCRYSTLFKRREALREEISQYKKSSFHGANCAL